jgi:hypothetical protein
MPSQDPIDKEVLKGINALEATVITENRVFIHLKETDECIRQQLAYWSKLLTVFFETLSLRIYSQAESRYRMGLEFPTQQE